MKLSQAPLGTPVMLTGGTADAARSDRAHLRMHELGLRPGALLTVRRPTPFGGRVVVLGTRRIALDGRTARALAVHPVEPTRGEDQ